MHSKQLINKPLSAISARLIKVVVGELEQRTGSTPSSGKVWQHNPINRKAAERLKRKGSTPSSGKVWQHNPINRKAAERLKRAKAIASPVAAN